MIEENIKRISDKIPSHVELVAVSKTKSTADILEAYKAGQCIFGENKIQEMATKYEQLPKDIEWHMIGHLQRNKIKYMANFVSLIHGVDSFKTLVEINKQATKHRRVINCLLQAKIAKEDSKFGLTFDEILAILASDELSELKNIKVVGLMGMATFTDDQAQLRVEFLSLKNLFDELSEKYVNLKTLSMGMSGDYELAIDCGSNMIRVGSSIFGARNYIT